MEKHISLPLSKEDATTLRAGDYVYLTGTMYTARDAAHKRMQEALDAGETLPISLEGNVIYYMGPLPREKDAPSAPQVPPPQAAWINTRRPFWIWD